MRRDAFDRVNHDVLMARLARKVKDKRLSKLIRCYVGAGIMVDGVRQPVSEGTPGVPVVVGASNIMLQDFDQEFRSHEHRFVRYANDIRVFVKSEPQPSRCSNRAPCR